MRPHRRAGLLAGMIVAAACLLAPATVAAATLTLTPAAGPPTAGFKLSGTGFRASGIVDVYWGSSHVGFIGTNASGGFSGWSTSVPATAKPGVHYVTVRNDGAPGGAQAVFTVRTNWAGFQGGGAQRGFNATENTLSRTTADGLEHDWTLAGAATRIPPAISAGVLYSLDNAGDLRAFNLAARTRKWQKRLGVPSMASSGALAVGTANVYAYTIAGGVGTLGAYSITSGNLVWRATFPSAGAGGGPVLAGGVVYVAVSTTARAETLYAFSSTCGTGGATCTPLWRGAMGTSTSTYPAPAAVAAGKVFVHGGDRLHAFQVGCATQNAACTPAWSSDAADGFVTGAPVYSNGFVYIGSYSGMLAYAAECTGTCGPTWESRSDGQARITREPAVAGSRLWTIIDDGTLAAYDTSCGGAYLCEPRCTAFLGGVAGNAPLVVANGLVYARMDETIMAVPATCSGATIPAPVWSARTRASSFTAPVVADGTVYVASPDPVGVLAFSLGPAAR